MSEETGPRQPSGVGIALFGRTFMLTGWHALVFLAFLVTLLIVLLYRFPGLRSPLWISAALWIAMMAYWNAAQKQTAPIASSESAASRSRHQLMLKAALLLLFVRFPWTGYRWLPRSAWVVPAGFAVHAAAILLDLWAMRCLGRNWSGAVTIKVDHELVKTGPYRLVRHPIYTAMIGMYLGTAIVSGELHGLLAVLLVVIAYGRKTLIEERGLREVFGTAYEDYARSTAALSLGVLGDSPVSFRLRAWCGELLALCRELVALCGELFFF
jgi:protein-S-isoprenylcysteine O-methyltransferase Ste14